MKVITAKRVDDFDQKLKDYEELTAAIKELDEKATKIKEELKDQYRMDFGDENSLTVRGTKGLKLVLSKAETRRMKTTAFREAHPKLFEEYSSVSKYIMMRVAVDAEPEKED